MDNKRVQLFIETGYKFKQIRIADTLNLMPQSEMVTLMAITDILKKNPEKLVYASDIAEYLEITAPAVSRTLSHLENKGLIERNIHKGDRRNVYVLITDKGRDTVSESMYKVCDFMEGVLSHLSDEEVMQLSMLYNKLYESMVIEVKKLQNLKGEK